LLEVLGVGRGDRGHRSDITNVVNWRGDETRRDPILSLLLSLFFVIIIPRFRLEMRFPLFAGNAAGVTRTLFTRSRTHHVDPYGPVRVRSDNKTRCRVVRLKNNKQRAVRPTFVRKRCYGNTRTKYINSRRVRRPDGVRGDWLYKNISAIWAIVVIIIHERKKPINTITTTNRRVLVRFGGRPNVQVNW